MTDCKQRYRELTQVRDVVLDEDLAALERMSERVRIEKYNDLKRSEEEFLFEFTADCPDFFTDAEQDRIRSEFRLARLLLAASFYDGGELPRALEGDFVEAELQAVVEFDRYKAFDALDEEGIRKRIRRMEGEVYELVTEYHSTQLADLDDLLEDPEVQRDVMERLLDRYEDRFEKVRQGFYAYVESHGLEHTVETIEEAVTAVADAEREREAIRQELQEGLEALEATVEREVTGQRQVLESRLQALEREVATGTVDPETLAAELDDLREEEAGLSEAQTAAIEAIADRIDETTALEGRLDEKIAELESVREAATEEAREAARDETVAVVESELEALREQRDELQRELEHLRRERESIEAASDRLEERRSDLEARVEEVGESVADQRSEGEVVTGSLARLYELDYIGRFDTSIHEVETIHTPDGEFEVPDGYWEDKSEHHSDAVPGEGEQRPVNSRLRFQVTDSRYLGLSRDVEMVIEAAVYSHLSAYEENGFDAAPADLEDLLELVDEAVYEAEREDFHYLLGVASPTGWTDRVRQQVQEGQARTRVSRQVSVCLVDLQDGDVLYDPSDELAEANAELFELSVDAERVEACREFVREQYAEPLEHDSVLLSDVVDAGYDVQVAQRAFDDLEREGVGERLHLDELGASLVFEE